MLQLLFWRSVRACFVTCGLYLALPIMAGATSSVASRVWNGEEINVRARLEVHVAAERREEEAPGAILYVMNHAAPRVGTEPDEPILRDFLAEGYVVVTADFGGHPDAVPPALDRELLAIHNALYSNDLFDSMPAAFDRRWIYVVPAGYRLKRDLVYWEMDRHGAHGTLQHIMREYNRRSGHPRVSRPEEMRRPNGEPLDYTLRMDIIYPSQPESPTPVLMMQSSSSPRNSSQRRRSHHIGFLMRGYAFVHYEHNYNPLARSDHFGFFHPYSMDPYNGIASNTAAVRCVRAHASDFGLDPDRIGVWGHSKASYGAALLGNPRHDELNEHASFDGFPPGSPEPQPWPDYASSVTVGYQSAGDGTQRHRALIGPDYVPVMTSVGDRDSLIAAEYWQEHFHHLEQMDVPHLALYMEGVGHTFPVGYDARLGLDRYDAVFDFFGAHLKPDSSPTPHLFYALPRDGETGVHPVQPVELRFATRMNRDSITGPQGVQIVEADSGRSVPGLWMAAQRETVFRWRPDAPLAEGRSYILRIPATVAASDGAPAGIALSHRFVAGELPVDESPKVDEYRRQHDLLYGIADAVHPPYGAWPEVGVTVDSLPAFSISPYSSLHYTAGYRIVEDDRSDGSGRYYLRWRSGGEGEIKIDFGEPRTVSHLVVRSGSADGRELLSGLRLRYSNESPEAMHTILEVKDNQDQRLSLTFAPVTGRYFHIDRIPLDSAVRLQDGEMYERPRPLDPELSFVRQSLPTPLLNGRKIRLRALASDGSVGRVTFRIDGGNTLSADAREGNLFESIHPGSAENSVTLEARGVTGDGRIVEAEPVHRPIVRPQMDLARAFPPEHTLAVGDWKREEEGWLSPSNGMLLVGEGTWGDFVLEADVQVESLSGLFSLIFRAQDSRNFDRFDFRRPRGEMRFVRDGSAERIRRNFDLTMREGETYTLRLEAYGRSVRLLVDGVEAFAFNPLDHERGGIGFSTSNARIRLRDLRVYFPGLPEDPVEFAAAGELFPTVDEAAVARENGVFPPDVLWFSSTPDALTVQDRQVRQEVPGTAYVVAYLSEAGQPLVLSPNQMLEVIYRFSISGISSSTSRPWYRAGLFNSDTGAGRLRADGFGVSQPEFSGYAGYLLDVSNFRAGSLALHRRSNASSRNLMSSLRTYSRVGDTFSNWRGLRDGDLYEGRLRVSRVDDGAVKLGAELRDASGEVLYVHEAESKEDAVTAFDTFAFMLSGASADSFTLHEVNLSLQD